MSRENGKARGAYFGSKTMVGGTETSHGNITHLAVDTPFGTIDAPVMVSMERDYDGSPVPLMCRDGGYLYALPGGGHIKA